MTILNLTQHPASAEQIAGGVVEPTDKGSLRSLLTFVGMPSKSDVKDRAKKIAEVASEEGFEAAMIGGAPYLMAPLQEALKAAGVTPLYAYSERKSEEFTDENGEVKKRGVFRHLGFVEGQ